MTMNEMDLSSIDKFGSTWCMFEDGRVYLRRSIRNIGEERRETLELANCVRDARFDNIQPNTTMKSTGFMRRLLNELEVFAMDNGLVLYVENVQSGFLPEWFVKRGYTKRFSYGDFSPSFYKSWSLRIEETT